MTTTYYDELDISHRVLKVLNPAFKTLRKVFPKTLSRPTPKQRLASAMFEEKNWIYNAIFPKFFERISVDVSAVESVKASSEVATVIYVMPSLGHLEYNYYNDLFLKHDLPLAEYNNSLTLRRWMKLRDYLRTIIDEECDITEFGHVKDTSEDGTLRNMIAEGKSVLIKIPSSALADEGLFYTGHMRFLREIVAAQKISEKPLHIVPLDFLWSRHPKKYTRSLADILFGEKESPGHIRKTVMFWKNYKTQAQAVIGKPIDISEIVRTGSDSEEVVAERIRSLLIEALSAKKRSITGPPIRPRKWIINEVLSDDSLDEKICKMASEHGKSADEVRELAVRYIKEIAADIDYTYVEFVDKLLSPVFNRIYESFDVDVDGLRRTQELYAEGPVVFVPNHKSHVDYLILSHVFYHNAMTVPHITAGLNLSFWPLGKIFRRCGAYFIRRHFKGNVLYKNVLGTYLKVLLKEGFAQEFFIEGGRSRTGKLRNPKYGMLNMLHDAAKDAKLTKLRFIPVSLTYDRVIEQKSYVMESEGVEKSSEHTTQLIGLTKYLKKRPHKHGTIYVRFGDAVEMDLTGDSHSVVPSIASDISNELNGLSVATPSSVAATVLLSGTRRGITVDEFKSGARDLIDYLARNGVEISPSFRKPNTLALDASLSMLARTRLVAERNNAFWPHITIDESKRLSLAFFKNGIAHFLIPASLIAKYILVATKNGRSIGQDKIAHILPESIAFVAPYFAAYSGTFTVANAMDAVSFFADKGALSFSSDGSIRVTPEGRPILRQFASYMMPYVETLKITLTYLIYMKEDSVEEKLFYDGLHRTGEDLFNLGRIRYREAINRFDFQDCLDMLRKRGLISKVEEKVGWRSKNMIIKSGDMTEAKNLQVALEKLL